MKVTLAIVMASRYFKISFRVYDVHFVSGNWTGLLYFNPDDKAWCRYSWNITRNRLQLNEIFNLPQAK